MSFLDCTALRWPNHLLFAAAVIAWSICAPSQAAQPGREAIGDWRLTSVLDNVDITSIDDAQATKLLGRVMAIRKEGTRFGDQTCGAPSLDTERVEPNLYVRREARISAKKLHLPNPVTVVDIGCTHVFIKAPDHAVIFWDGFYFGAVKVKDPGRHRH
jgi:hypothetical protein